MKHHEDTLNTNGACALERRCPECGLVDSREAGERAARLSRWRRRIPLLAVAVYVGVMASLFLSGISKYGGGAPAPSAYRDPCEFVTPAFTADELGRIASGAVETDGALSRAILERCTSWLVRPPGREVLYVRFLEWEGSRMDTTVYGWPCAVLTTSQLTEFDGAAPDGRPVTDARLYGVLPGLTWSVSMWGIAWQRVDSGGSRDAYVSMGGVVSCLALVVAAWYVGGWMGLIAASVRGILEMSKRTRVKRRVGVVVALGAVLALLTIAAGTPRRSTKLTSLAAVGRVWPGTQTLDLGDRKTDLTYAEIQKLAVEEGGDRVVAARLLKLVEGNGLGETARGVGMLRLAASFTPDSMSHQREDAIVWPASLASRKTVQRWRLEPGDTPALWNWQVITPSAPVTDADRVTWPAAGMVVRMFENEIQVAMPRWTPTQTLTVYSVNVACVLSVMWWGWTVWQVSKYACSWWAKRSMQAKIDQNRCVGCGYSLLGIEPVGAERLGQG